MPSSYGLIDAIKSLVMHICHAMDTIACTGLMQLRGMCNKNKMGAEAPILVNRF